MTAKINQPGEFPEYRNARPLSIDRRKFLDGSIPVFWGPDQLIEFSYSDPRGYPYRPPGDWPAAGDLLRVPRVVRFLHDGRSADIFGPRVRYREPRYDGDFALDRSTSTSGAYIEYAVDPDDDHILFVTDRGTGPRTAPPASNLEAWNGVGTALRESLDDWPNLWVNAPQAEGDGAAIDLCIAQAPRDKPDYFGTDVLNIVIVSRSFLKSLWLAEIRKIRDQYPRFAGFRMALFIDLGFLTAISTASPGVPAATQSELASFAADLADCGVTYHGTISYTSPSVAPFAAAIRAAWPA